MSDAMKQLAALLDPGGKAPAAPVPRFGTVASVSGDEAMVRFDGAGDAVLTPCAMEVACRAGDRITGVIQDHRGRVTGNITSRPTDDTAAEEAREIAEEAREIAENAGDSSEAKAAAEHASADARAAKEAAEAASADAEAAKSAVKPILDEYESVRDEAQAAAREVAEIRDSMESTYARKTDLTETEAVLLTYIEQSSAAYMIAASMEITGRPAATEEAGSALREAEAALDSAASNLASARSLLLKASDELDGAEAAYKAAQADGDAEAIARAEQDVADARAAYEKAEADCAEAQRAFMKAEQGFIDKYNAAITVQADMIRSQVTKTEAIGQSITELETTVTQTADAIVSEARAREDGDKALSSAITQTAGEIRSEVEAADGALASSISQTAADIRSEVAEADGALSSRIDQNADSISSEVTAREDGDAALGTRITQSVESITSTVSDIDGRLSAVEQTADGITVRLDSGEFDGRGIESMETRYKLSESGDAKPSGAWDTWSASPLSPTATQYLWSWTRVAYTDGTHSDSYAVGGKSGTDGDGQGISSIQTQYYLSTSQYSQTGGSWSDTPQAYVSGRYYWERDKITYTDNTTGYSTAVLSRGLNSANATAASASAAASNAQTSADAAQRTADGAQTTANSASATASSAATTANSAKTTADNAATAAANAAKTATDYLTYSSSGLDVGYSSTAGKTRITSTGMSIYKGSTELASFTASKIELGKNANTSTVEFCGAKAKVGYSALRGAYFAGDGSAYLLADTNAAYCIGIDKTTQNEYIAEVGADTAYLYGGGKSLETDFDNVIMALSHDVLFTGNTNGSVSLSASAVNYSHMRIFFRDAENYSSVDVYSPNGKTAFLHTGKLTSSTWQRAVKVVSISGRSVSVSSKGYMNTVVGTGAGYSANSSDNNIYITRIEAWN